jgi:hypothetical protein
VRAYVDQIRPRAEDRTGGVEGCNGIGRHIAVRRLLLASRSSTCRWSRTSSSPTGHQSPQVLTGVIDANAATAQRDRSRLGAKPYRGTIGV